MIQHQWTGPNGTVTNLTTYAHGGVWLSNVGIEGMGFPTSTDWTRDTPGLAGQRFTGSKENPRDVFWPVVIDGSDGSWFELQKQFWGSLRPGEYGAWRVTAPDGTARELVCRFVPEDQVYAVDPSTRGVEVHGVRLIADDPWWRGEPNGARFSADDLTATPFFLDGGPADRLFYLGSGFTAANAFVANPGDVPAWPIWTITGPVDSFSVGIAGSVISAEFTIPDGQFVTIDTSPENQLGRWSNGSLIPLANFSSADFAQVPPESEVPLFVEMQGDGAVEISVTPRFYRAF